MTVTTVEPSVAFQELVEILSPASLGFDEGGNDVFRGLGSTGDGAMGTFGGHFLGQAVASAQRTVGDDRNLHSIHAYFLRGGEPNRPIDYTVERLRDGRSFSTRRVHATQGDRVAFELMASFCVPAQDEEISAQPPDDFTSLPDPLSLPLYHQLMATHDPVPLPEAWALREHGVDVRVVNAPWSPNGPSKNNGIRMWIRANGELPNVPALHTAMLAYQSDESIADNVLVPFGVTWGSPGVFFVSLDHAMWFHRPVNLNNWHFVEQRPVTAVGGRGTATGTVWNQAGELVASMTQEALMRTAGATNGP